MFLLVLNHGSTSSYLTWLFSAESCSFFLGNYLREDSLSLRVQVCPSREDCCCQVARATEDQGHFKLESQLGIF